jgi:hypothetical protein
VIRVDAPSDLATRARDELVVRALDASGRIVARLAFAR